MAKRKRDVPVLVWVSAEELELIHQKMQQYGTESEVCHTPKELFDLLADDYRTYLEIELTKGKREETEDDEREADALCKPEDFCAAVDFLSVQENVDSERIGYHQHLWFGRHRDQRCCH